MHAVSLAPHAQKHFLTTSKSENHMQNSDGMQSKLKMHEVSMKPHADACGVIDTACTMHAMSMTTHARSTSDSNSPGSL
jgi:hypothetical protein